jgi:coenzyme PQQ precursor peptide PqqA
VIGIEGRGDPHGLYRLAQTHRFKNTEEYTMKIWNKPQVREQEVGLEVTSYLPAEIDII